MAMDADIGVVITSHNYGRYLKACLESVVTQTIKPNDVVVVDDASDDDAEDVVRGFEGVRYFRVDFRNGNRARNFGFAQMVCEYVTFFDADNVMMPTFLAQLYQGLQKDQTAAFAYCDRINFLDSDADWYPHPMGQVHVGEFDKDRLLTGNYIDLAALIRSTWFSGFDEELRRYQDWDLWLNIVLKHGGYGCYVPEPLFRYRIHSHNISRNEDRDLAMWHIRRKYRIGWGKLPLLRHSYRVYLLMCRLKRYWVK